LGICPYFYRYSGYAYFEREKIKPWGWIGIIISFLGVSLVAIGEGEEVRFEPAAFLILLAAISTSFCFVL